ncbi:hypothetical protein D3C77_494850 [compost metagenome]
MLKQSLTEAQLLLQGLFGLAARLEYVAQVAVPENHSSYQQAGAQHNHRYQLAVVVPGAVADHCIDPPAAGQLGHIVWRDAEQGLVEDRVQHRGVMGDGEGGGARPVTEDRGDAQTVLEHPGDEVVGIDLRRQGDVDFALRHILHQRQRVVDFDQRDGGELRLQLGFQGVAAQQGQAHAFELLGAL